MSLILVVDDEFSVARSIETNLKKIGYGAHVCNGGEEAIHFLENSLPDLIVLDFLMPKVGGEDVLRFLRGNEATHTVPVIVISGFRVAEQIAEFCVEAILQKPFHFRELRGLLENLLSAPAHENQESGETDGSN